MKVTIAMVMRVMVTMKVGEGCGNDPVMTSAPHQAVRRSSMPIPLTRRTGSLQSWPEITDCGKNPAQGAEVADVQAAVLVEEVSAQRLE